MISLGAEAKLIVLGTVLDRLERLAAERLAVSDGERELYLPASDLVRELRALLQARPKPGAPASSDAMDQLALWSEVYRGQVPQSELVAYMLTECVTILRELGGTRAEFHASCDRVWTVVEDAESVADETELDGELPGEASSG